MTVTLEEARQKAAELTEAYKQQQSSLDSQIKKYKELKESLDNGNLSIDEARSIKEQLLEIQNLLIDTYGTEISSVDLLNGKYREQLGLLYDLSKKKAVDYVIEHEGDYKTAKRELEKIRTYKIGEVIAGVDDAKMELVNYLKSYDSELLDIGTMGTNPNAISISVKANAVEADKLMHQLAKDLQEWADKNDIDHEIIEPLQIGISKYAGKTMTDALKQHKTVYDEYMKAKILSDDTLRPLYLQSIQAVEAYNKALSSGEGVEAAKANVDSVQQSVQNATSILEGSQDIFDNIYEAINKNAEAAYQLNQAFENDETVKGYAEQLRGLSDYDLKAINFKDNIESPGEEAFGALIDILGLSEDEVQKLIDKLVELGYVQGQFQDAPPKVPDSFSTQLTKSQDSLDKFQSAVKSAADAYTTLLSGNYSSSELLDSIQAINKAASDMGKAIDWESISASGNPLQAIQDEIESVSESYANSVLNGIGIDVDSKFGRMLANIVQETYESDAALSSLNKQIDSLQSAYNSLTDIVSAYNETGYITFDQLQTLLALEPQYLSCLVDESGQLSLNQEAMLALANQRLDDAEAQAVQQAITELGQLTLQEEKTAVEENAAAFSNAVNDLTSYNVELADTIGEASVAASVIRDLNAAISGAKSDGATGTQIDTVLNNLNTKLQLIKTTQTGLNNSLGNIMGGSSSGFGSATSEFSEAIDFFERRITVLDDALAHLKSTMDNVSGSFGKNNLLDAELGITEEKFKNYSDALSMYTQKANEAFAKIPADIAAKAKDGAVALNDFIGDGNQDVVEAIKDYESWAGKVSDCQQNLAELKKEIRQLELEKFNNTISDFSNQFDFRENSKNLISKQIDLLKEAGELIGESFYSKQIEQSQKQLHLLEAEKTSLVQQLNDALSSGHIQKGTDEWLEMVNALSDVDGNILDCKKSIEEFDNSILALHTEIFERIQSAFGNISDEISNLLSLMEDSDVGLSDGSWTKEGLTQLGLYAQQYELAKYQVSQYAGEIEKLNADYLNGRYSAAEYADKLADLSSAQWDAVNAAESAKDAIVDLNKARVDIAVDSIQEQIDAYKELTDAQTKALQAEKDLHDYERSLAEKEKDIAKLRKQIAAMQNDNSASTVAKRKQLEEQLTEALADLEETQYQHSIEAQEEALNQQYESYEEARNAQIEALEDSLKDEEKLISDSLNAVKRNTETISNQIVQIARDHGVKVSNEIVNAWKSGENAIASYGEVLTAGTSAFIGQIQSVETQIYQLQDDADVTAATLSNLFATKADNLVNELAESYYAEANLYNMTQALQNSLTATLEGDYDVSSIVNSLNIIKKSAEDTKKTLEEIPNSPENIPDTPISPKKPAKVSNGPFVPIAYDDESDGEIKKKTGGVSVRDSSFSATFYPYAYGSPNIPQDQLAVTNEDGQEIIYHAEDNSLLTRLSAGDKVFDNASVNRLWEISHGNLPAALIELLPSLQQPIPFSVPPVVSSVKIPDRTNARPIFHYDSLVTINGDVNDTDHFIKQMAKVADQQITKSWKKFNDEFKY